jgi:hypothetical protein
MEQCFRILLQFFRGIGTEPQEARRALRAAARNSTRKPFHSSEAHRFALWLVLGEIWDAWNVERAYIDDDGLPRALPIEGTISFSSLTKRYLPQESARDVARFLTSIGVLTRLPDGKVQPRGSTQRTQGDRRDQRTGGAPTGPSRRTVEAHGHELFIPQLTAMTLERIPVLLHGLLSTIADNTRPKSGNATRLELSVQVPNLSEEDVAKFNEHAKKKGQAFVIEMNAWLLRCLRENRADVKRSKSGRTWRVSVNAFADVELNRASSTPKRIRVNRNS